LHNDAKGCYDRIISGVALASLRRLGYSKESVKILGLLWAQMEHHVVRSKTALDIFGLEGQVPESRVKGETADIYTISEYGWYDWVKFRETAASFPVYKIQLGRDLGAAIEIGIAMSRKILKANCQIIYRTSVRSLTLDEIQSPTELA
jgi:hypothetical protein